MSFRTAHQPNNPGPAEERQLGLAKSLIFIFPIAFSISPMIGMERWQSPRPRSDVPARPITAHPGMGEDNSYIERNHDSSARAC
jgi:hypothetical protein